jgi:hypothetical protein
MLHQLVFQSLLGEIDYGAMGDFTPAGCVRKRCGAAACGAGVWRRSGCRAPGPGVCACRHGLSSTARLLAHVGCALTARAPEQLQQCGHLVLERPRRRLDLPGAVSRAGRCPAPLVRVLLGELRHARRRSRGAWAGGGRSVCRGETDQARLSTRGMPAWG